MIDIKHMHSGEILLRVLSKSWREANLANSKLSEAGLGTQGSVWSQLGKR